MTRVDFYVMASADHSDRLQLVCKLAEKALQRSQKVFIHSDSDDTLKELDDLLWSFRPVSFVPHHTVTTDDTPTSTHSIPVILSKSSPDSERTLLINLAADVPPFFSRFERTLEIVNEQTHIKEAGRERYRYYQQRGYPLQHHKM